MALNDRIITHVNNALHQCAKADPALQTIVDALADRTLKVHITDMDLVLYWVSEHDHWGIRSEVNKPCDAVLSGSSVALFFIGVSQLSGEAPQFQGIRVEGDMNLAMQLQTLLKTVRLDKDICLSECLGDRGAAALMSAGRFLGKVARAVGEDLGQRTRLGPSMVVGTREVRDFCDEVDAFVASVDRLSARMKERKA